MPGAAALWTVGSFLLGQGVVFGGVLINNAAQARRERAARGEERQRLHADRRETFELAHLQDLHAELTELLLVANLCVEQWRNWLTMLEPSGQRASAHTRTHREELEASATELQQTAEQHLEKVHRLGELVIPDRLRALVAVAHSQYAFVLETVLEPERASVQGLPLSIGALKVAQAAVAARIREIYITAENLPGATAGSQ